MMTDLRVYYPAEALRDDHSYCGIVFEGTAGEELGFGDSCYLKNDGKMWKSDADAAATMPATAIALGTIHADTQGDFLLSGLARDDSWAWIVGGVMYASLAAGALTQDVSAYTTGDQVQAMGAALSATVILLNPSPVLVEIA